MCLGIYTPRGRDSWNAGVHTCTHARMCTHTHTHTQTVDRHAGHVFIQSLCRYPTAMHFDDADKGLPHSNTISFSPFSFPTSPFSPPQTHTHTHTHTHTSQTTTIANKRTTTGLTYTQCAATVTHGGGHT